MIPNQGVAFAHEPWRTTTGVSYYQRLYDYALDEIGGRSMTGPFEQAG